MLDEKDLRMDYFSTGSGASAAIRIAHLPTGHIVDCDKFPSQAMNKCFALGMLTERVNHTSGD